MQSLCEEKDEEMSSLSQQMNEYSEEMKSQLDEANEQKRDMQQELAVSIENFSMLEKTMERTESELLATKQKLKSAVM